jgi:ABC exporter DevB family membrane fusion protein
MKRLLVIVLLAASGASLTFLVSRPTARFLEQLPASNQSEHKSSSIIEGIGYVEPASELRRLMFRTGGVIRSCFVHPGDVVGRGDLLVELDNSTQQADLALARKQLEQAKADAADVNAGVNPYRLQVLERTIERLREKARHARADLERYDKLVGKGGVSKQDYDQTWTARTQAEIELREQEAELLHLRNYVTPEKRALMAARIDQAKANLRLAEERLGETRITAPCDGAVLKVIKQAGEGVSAFVPETVLLFGDLSRLRVRAEIDERFVQNVQVGQSAEAYGRNLLGKSYPGRIIQVEKIMGDKTVFTRASSERKDLHILQVVIEMESGFAVPVGLQVDVRIHP